MANKPIIQIDVQDDKFVKFKASYDQYVESLKKLPGAWGAQAEQVEKTGVSFVELAAALFAQAELTKNNTVEHEKVEKSTKKTASFWKSIKDDSKKTLENITSTTEQLLKWTGLTTIAAGLLGVGGLFGADKLAATTAGYRRQGFGINATIGEQRAFQIDYQKYLANPSGFLSGVNEVGNDLSKQGTFLGQQIGSLTRQGVDSAQIATQVLPGIIDRFVAMGGMKGMGAQLMGPLGLSDAGLSLQDVQSLARQRQGLGQSGSDFRRDSNYLGVSQDTADKMQNFTNQLERAGGKIETIFVNNLGHLEPGIEKLSKAAVDLLDSFLKSDRLSHWLDEVSDGMERLAGWLDPSSKPGGAASSGSWSDNLARKIFGDAGSDAAENHAKNAGWLDELNSRQGLPKGLLAAVATHESGWNDYAVSKTGAMGAFQFMPSAAEHYNLTNPRDFQMSAAAASNYFKDELKIFKGDLLKAAAAYSEGDAAVKRQIAMYGDQWRNHLPKETSDYVRYMEVKVLNQTGGSAVISANQVAQ